MSTKIEIWDQHVAVPGKSVWSVRIFQLRISETQKGTWPLFHDANKHKVRGAVQNVSWYQGTGVRPRRSAL